MPKVGNPRRGDETRPNFFIVGAPKAGTSSLYDYIGQHPEAYASIHKQPHFFDTDVDIIESQRIGGRKDAVEEYLALYADAGPQHKAIGDGSVWYLHSQRAPQAIHAFSPDAKIIIMLRNPVDYMYSSHADRVRWLHEDIVDFAEALAAEPDRAAGRRIPARCNKPCALQYRRTACYSSFVERYLKEFGPDRVMVILFDDFVSDTQNVYRQVLRFLGLNESFVPDFTPVNKGTDYPKFYSFKRRLIALGIGRRLMSFWWKIKVFSKAMLPAAVFYGVRDAIGMLNKTPARRPMDPELRAKLQEEFRSEIERLEAVIDRDLSGWCRRAVPAAQSAGDYAAAPYAAALEETDHASVVDR